MVHSHHKVIPNKPIQPVTKFPPALKLKYFLPSSQELLHRVLLLARLTQITFSLIIFEISFLVLYPIHEYFFQEFFSPVMFNPLIHTHRPAYGFLHAQPVQYNLRDSFK